MPGRADRYVALPSRHTTLVQQRRHGSVARRVVIRGRFGVPGAAYDGSTTGLSADGRTLVLAAFPPPHPQRRTRMVVLDARRLRVERRIAPAGSFTVDAISPAGRWLYLIHYTDAGNTLRYEVRAYDTQRGRLLARPIVDPREPDEKMLGTPVTRAMSADGRWAYTLYQRPGGAPFVHALDTQGRTAACIDLDRLANVDPSTLKLVVPRGHRTLRVVSPDGAQAVIDRRTFAVSKPSAGRRAVKRATAGHAGDGGAPPWAAAGGALASVAGLALIATLRRRYARAAS